MKYMLTWTERPQGSPMEYENAQKQILEVFTQWKAPGNFKIELFVIRVGDWGGYMLLDCDDATAVHKFCSMLPAFVFEARPVIPIEDAVQSRTRSDCLPRRTQTQVILGHRRDVRFTPESGHSRLQLQCRFVPIADITCRRMKAAGAFNGLPRELRTRHNIQPI